MHVKALSQEMVSPERLQVQLLSIQHGAKLCACPLPAISLLAGYFTNGNSRSILDMDRWHEIELYTTDNSCTQVSVSFSKSLLWYNKQYTHT